MIAVDLGSRTTKAVLLERRGEIYALTRYAMLDAPILRKKSRRSCYPIICTP